MNNPDGNHQNRMALFQKREIRRTVHNNEWWFVITDIIAALTDSANPSGYLRDMRRRDPSLPWSLRQPAGVKKSSAGTPKASSA